MKKNTLIVDDDTKLQKLLKEYLEQYGFNVISLMNGAHVIDVIRSEDPDILILDIMLPDKDGLEVLKEIRRSFTVPVIMLTARGEDMDRIIGLELGADDYLPKPFNPRELLARMKAILRRHQKEEREERSFIRSGELILNRSKQTLLKKGREVELSTTEYKILEAMMERPNTVISRDQLMIFSRGRELLAFDRSIDVHISRLRRKLETILESRKRIKTIWGSGYMFMERL